MSTPSAFSVTAYVSDPGSYLTGGLGEVLLGNLGSGQVGKWWFYYETGRIMQVMGLFIVGLLLGRFGFFHHPNKFRWQRMMALLGSVAAAVVLLAVHRTIARFGSGPSFWTDVLVSGWFNLACTAISLLVFVAFWQAGGEFVLRPLSPAECPCCGRGPPMRRCATRWQVGVAGRAAPLLAPLLPRAASAATRIRGKPCLSSGNRKNH